MKNKLFGVLLLGIFVLELTGYSIRYPDLEKN